MWRTGGRAVAAAELEEGAAGRSLHWKAAGLST
jgi:hypothetical protein